MKTKVRGLDKGEMILGTLVDFLEEDGFMEVTFELRKRIRLEHHVDSEIGAELKKKITEEMVGKRVGIFYFGMGKDPVRVMVREEESEG